MRAPLLALACLLPATSGRSELARYSFSGHITTLDRDNAGTIAALGFAVGDPVAVVFEIDFAQPGRSVLNNGDTIVLAPYSWDELRIDYFYARLIAGTRLPEVNGGMYNDPEDVSESLTGWNRTDWTGQRGVLQGGSRDSSFRLDRFDPYPGGTAPDWRVQDWRVGTTVWGHIAGMSDLDFSLMTAEMRLDSILPVPEPTTVSLFLLGSLLWFGFGRRCATNRHARNPECQLAALETTPANPAV